ncbi:MAG TPA: hypothetical protein VN578_04080, partial [Candidatus Binatia bacterium]|nr:hypothetical protein [Candidatus Binatia bacterium]
IGLATLIVTNTASDNDIPATILSYALTMAPTNAVISTNGVITWTPVVAQVPSTNVFTTLVTDNGTPALSATNSFLVFVNFSEVPPPPVVIQSIILSNSVATITWNTSLGYTYRLQYKNDLTNGSWLDAPPDLQASGPTATATNDITGSSQRFYRILLVR